MSWPPLLIGASPRVYREHFYSEYCSGTILTFDGIRVRFQKKDFNHAFFESVGGKDNEFSVKRAERIGWIKATILSPDTDLLAGWDRRSKAYDNSRRVALVMKDYVVVIQLISRTEAKFVTAFVADSPRTLSRIKGSPKWVMPKSLRP